MSHAANTRPPPMMGAKSSLYRALSGLLGGCGAMGSSKPRKNPIRRPPCSSSAPLPSLHFAEISLSCLPPASSCPATCPNMDTMFAHSVAPRSHRINVYSACGLQGEDNPHNAIGYIGSGTLQPTAQHTWQFSNGALERAKGQAAAIPNHGARWNAEVGHGVGF